ncbi:helix-turn-helix transcriptional regulator [Microbacterium sp. NPDC077391]|uniref:helix-turn-helix transcriptional regulator n=1 Tax=unclassified Microbacterium TaxID=2609290 RepID=UPI0028A5EFA6|nr:helix-turn-helix transcriptional regulator [Microbacterium sp.]
MAEILRMDSDDVDDVEEIWKTFVPSASLLRIDPENFAFRWRSATLRDVAIVRYSLTAEVHSRVQPEDQLFASRLVAADSEVRTRRSIIEPGMPWATDSAQVEAEWNGTAEVSALILDRVGAQELARRVTGDELLSLRVTSVHPCSDLAARQWVRAFDYLLTSAMALDGAEDELIEAGLIRHALTSILSCFPSTFSSAIARDGGGHSAATVRRALAYIDEHAHLPITVDDVAAAVHISTRGLQYAFRRGIDTTPTEYLRRVRLDGAHRDLRDGGADESVTRIARRWGFANSSRFNSLYRQTYGRSAKDTLQGH